MADKLLAFSCWYCSIFAVDYIAGIAVYNAVDYMAGIATYVEIDNMVEFGTN